MRTDDYLLPKAADEADLSAWSSILPAIARPLRTNLFGDIFIVDEGGSVHMLERAGCSVQPIASSEEEFWRHLDDDDNGWQLRPLVDECRYAGKMLGDGQCYAFTILPVLGGDYIPENIWVAPWEDWYSFTAGVFHQIKDLPDGTDITLHVID